jgi:uncharacterized protein YkwD
VCVLFVGARINVLRSSVIFTVLLLLVAFAAPALAGEFEDELLGLINGYRSVKGLKPLVMKPELVKLAQSHSRTMHREKKLSHEGFKDRFKAARKFGAMGCVENVSWNYPTPATLLEGWQNSPGHDSNMLDPQVTGAGIVQVGQYTTFYACY